MTTIGSLEYQELMSQGKNLSLQCCPRSESLANRGKEQESCRDHGLSNLSRRRLKFNRIDKNRVFGRDNIAVADFVDGKILRDQRQTIP
jgi:hypothetical protein